MCEKIVVEATELYWEQNMKMVKEKSLDNANQRESCACP